MKILLDTSFILPTLGIDVNKEVLRGLELIKKSSVNLEIYVSRFSILEALWLSVKLIKENRFDENRFSLGLNSIFNSGRYKVLSVSRNSFLRALQLYKLGHQDMIDNILYAESIEKSMLFLSLDSDLRAFIEKNKLDKTLVFPNELEEIL